MSPPSQNQRQLANWVTDYAIAIDKISESPITYHLWTAISAISAVLKDNVWIDRGTHKLYPNQFIVLVGPPGIGKSNAIHLVNDFVKNPQNKVPLAHFIKDAITMPKLIEILSKGFPRVSFNNGHLLSSTEASCIMQISELPVLLDNNSSITNFLCEAWSRSDYDYSTKNGGVQTINNMCLSIIAACVPNFVKDINKSKGMAISNGLTSRIIFVYGDKKSKSIPFPASMSSMGIDIRLANDLEVISKMHGEFTLTQSASTIYSDKYHDIKPDDTDSDVVQNFKSRQPSHIMKVAMTLSAASRDDLVIDDNSMTTAITLVDGVSKTLDITFGGVGESSLAQAQDRIKLYIERKGVVSRNEILRDNYRHVTAEDLDRILATLVSIDFIAEFSQGSKRLFKHTAKGQKP